MRGSTTRRTRRRAAGTYQRSHVREQRRSVGGAPGFRMSEQRFERKVFVELFPNQAKQSLRNGRISRRSSFRLRANERVAHAGNRSAKYHRPNRLAERAKILLGYESREPQPGFVEGSRHLQTLAHLFECARRLVDLANRRNDEPQNVALTQRNPNDVSNGQLQAACIVGKRQIESGRANGRQRINGAHGRSRGEAPCVRARLARCDSRILRHIRRRRSPWARRNASALRSSSYRCASP